MGQTEATEEGEEEPASLSRTFHEPNHAHNNRHSQKKLECIHFRDDGSSPRKS
jgi:hypothetical protein